MRCAWSHHRVALSAAPGISVKRSPGTALGAVAQGLVYFGIVASAGGDLFAHHPGGRVHLWRQRDPSGSGAPHFRCRGAPSRVVPH